MLAIGTFYGRLKFPYSLQYKHAHVSIVRCTKLKGLKIGPLKHHDAPTCTMIPTLYSCYKQSEGLYLHTLVLVCQCIVYVSVGGMGVVGLNVTWQPNEL